MPRGSARHPGMSIQGMLSEEKLSPGFVSSFSCSPSRFELGLSAAVGSSQPLPLLREPRAPSDVVCPKTLLCRTKPTKAFSIRWSQPRSCRAPVPGTALFTPAGCGMRRMPGGLGIPRCGGKRRTALPAPRLLPGQHGRTRPAAPARPVLTCRLLSLPIPCPQPRGSSANLTFPHC